MASRDSRAPRFVSIFGAILALACAACADGGRGLLPASAPALGSAHERKAEVRFRFKIPSRRHRAHYLSPATRSISVTAYDATHTHQLAHAAINTMPGSGGCTAVSNGTFVCSFLMLVPPGNDTFDVTAYDAANEQGNRLSAISDFPVKVVAGIANKIALTLGGIPATLDVGLVGSSVFATGSAVSGFQFGGIGSGALQQLQLTAKDADGYTIVNPGAPALRLVSNAPSKVAIAAVSGTLGLFNVTPLAETNASRSPQPSTAITLTAAAMPIDTDANAVSPGVSVNVSLQNDPIAYVGNMTSTSVGAYAPWSSSPLLSLVLPTPTPEYVSVAVDTAGNVYASNWEGGTISVFPRGSTTPSRTISGLSDPANYFSLVVDASGDIFAIEEEGVTSNILEYTSGGSTPSRTIVSSEDPVGIALDTSGNLYVAGFNNNTVSVFAPGTSTTPKFSFSSGMTEPIELTFDSSGNLYVVNYGGVNVTEYNPPFSNTSAVAKTFGRSTDLFEPFSVAVDVPGNVYIADKGNSNVIEYTRAAPTAAARTFTTGTFPYDVVVDQLGYVYVPWSGTPAGPMSVYPPAPSTSTTPVNWTTGVDYPFSVAVWR
jgi:streptogramin lyase